ncbi:MAG: lanthionine synthetase LanC family protein [Ferruginibacter sp.]
MSAQDLYILPEDVLLTPVQELGDQTRSKFEYDENDFVITYSNARNTSKVIDASSASLVKEFRTPKSLPEGVFTYSVMNKLNAEKTLEDAYKFLIRLRSEGFLVLYDEAALKKNGDAFQPGDLFKGYEVVQKLQGVADTEVYKLKKDNSFFALKLLKTTGKSVHLVESFNNEIEALQLLDGVVNPPLVEHGEYENNSYLIMQWAEGLPCDQAAEKYRNTNNKENLSRLIDLSCAILSAYKHLHSQGIIHSDIHPRNVLVNENGDVSIIDFGLARIVAKEKYISRGGVGFFYEPEYAAAIINNSPQPQSSCKGEQYALAALLYLIFTGKQYLNFSFDKDTLFNQLLKESPTPFAAYDLDVDLAVEQVIFKGLSKNPEDRYTSIDEFYEQLNAIKNRISEEHISDLQYSFSAFCDTLKSRFGFNGQLIENGLQLAPTASVNYGAAGIAYMFYRMALAESNASLLSVADVWANRAAQNMNYSENSFYSKDIDITPDTVGSTSIYHSASGVYLVQALISKELGDYNTYYGSVMNFIYTATQPCDNLDLTLGKSATLTACAILFENLLAVKDELKKELVVAGNTTMQNIWEAIDDYAAIGEESAMQYNGIAHGWAGILYATIKWCAITEQPVPARFFDRVNQLLTAGIHEENLMRWNLTVDNKVSWPGWCHGSAGYTFLWTAIYRFTNDEKYLFTAEKTAKHFLASDAEGSVCNLCCGGAGECYALLNLYNVTQNAFYLTEAKRLAKKMLPHIYSGQMRNNSLYKGDIGVGVLLTELALPQFARMPLFE